MKKLKVSILQTIISWESAIGGPATCILQPICLKMMGVKLDGPVYIGSKVMFSNPQRLTLGQRVGIGEKSLIVCHTDIIIGNDFLAAPGLYLNSGTHDINTMEASAKPIKIGNRVWCGTRVTICSGVTVGDDVVIGAGSVVINSIPSGYLAAGVPAKPIKKIDRDIRKFQSWYSPTNWKNKFFKKISTIFN